MVRAALVATFFAMLSAVNAVTVSTDGQFNVTSPDNDSIYVAGQILPVVCQLNEAAASSFGLNIYLQSNSVNFTTTTIAQGITKDTFTQLTQNGAMVYQYTNNYAIPSTAPAGSYQVVLESTNTNDNTTISITMRPAVSSSSSAGASATGSSSSSGSSSGSSSSSSSIFDTNSGMHLAAGAVPVAAAALVGSLMAAL